MNEIDSREALVAHLNTLLDELQAMPDEPSLVEVANGISGWNNFSLYGFLEAMTRAIENHAEAGTGWLEDDPRAWRAIARAVDAGKGYE